MREFFRGWKRKTGCMTLVVACTIVVLSVRSHFTEDILILRCGESTFHRTLSFQDRFVWQRYSNVSRKWSVMAGFSTRWSSRNIENDGLLALLPVSMASRGCEKWCLQWDEFRFSGGDDPTVSNVSFQIWEVPYWVLILGPTALSACLLLSKPRPAEKQPDDTISD